MGLVHAERVREKNSSHENYTSCISLGGVWGFFLLNVSFMSFSNDNGATADVAAGCQKNLRNRQAAAMLVSVSLRAFCCSRVEKWE